MKTEEEKKHIEKKIFDIARQNLQTTGADRPEVKWLQERMACIQRRYKLKSKIQVDRLLCENAGERAPDWDGESQDPLLAHRPLHAGEQGAVFAAGRSAGTDRRGKKDFLFRDTLTAARQSMTRRKNGTVLPA